MTVKSVHLFRSLYWLQAGWRYFAANIGAWLAMSLLFFISIAIFIIIPRIGVFILIMLLPLLLAGLLYAIDSSERGVSPQVENIAYGFGLKETRSNLLMLGAIMLLYLFAVVLALHPLSGVLFQSLYDIHGTEQQTIMLQLSAATNDFLQQHALMLWLQMLLIISGLAAFSYAIPLTLFDGISPQRAIVLSLQGFTQNIVPLSILFVLGSVLIALATPAFGIGFLILLPVLVGANYAGYREIFAPEVELAAA